MRSVFRGAAPLGLAASGREASSSNAGGLFSEAEQGAADYYLNQKHAAAIYKVDPSGRSIEFAKASIRFLDDAGPEEKASFEWAKQRAGNQWLYEERARSKGKAVEDLSSGNSLVQILLQAWRELAKLEGTGKSLEDMPAYSEAQQMFGFRDPDSNVIDWTL